MNCGALASLYHETFFCRLRATPPVFVVGCTVVFEALACGYGMVPRSARRRLATVYRPLGENTMGCIKV